MQRFVAAALVRLGIVGAGAAGWGILPFLLLGMSASENLAGAVARAGSAGRNDAMTPVDGVTRR